MLWMFVTMVCLGNTEPQCQPYAKKHISHDECIEMMIEFDREIQKARQERPDIQWSIGCVPERPKGDPT